MNGDAMQRLAVVEQKVETLGQDVEELVHGLKSLTDSLNELVSTLRAGKWVAITITAIIAFIALGPKELLLLLISKLGG